MRKHFISSLVFLIAIIFIALPASAQIIGNTGNTTQIGNTGNTTVIGSTGNTGHPLSYIVGSIVNVVDSGIPILYALAFLFFVAGLARYTFIGQGEENREKGKQMMIYGLIGIIIMFVVWGIVNLGIGILTSLGGVSATS